MEVIAVGDKYFGAAELLVGKSELQACGHVAFEEPETVGRLKAYTHVAEKAFALARGVYAEGYAVFAETQGHVDESEKRARGVVDTYPLHAGAEAYADAVAQTYGGRIVIGRHFVVLRELRVSLRRCLQGYGGKQRGDKQSAEFHTAWRCEVLFEIESEHYHVGTRFLE